MILPAASHPLFLLFFLPPFPPPSFLWLDPERACRPSQRVSRRCTPWMLRHHHSSLSRHHRVFVGMKSQEGRGGTKHDVKNASTSRFLTFINILFLIASHRSTNRTTLSSPSGSDGFFLPSVRDVSNSLILSFARSTIPLLNLSLSFQHLHSSSD